MRLAFRIAARELRGGLAGFRVFVLCLMLGVAAIAGVGLVRDAVRAGLAGQGVVLLGGDAQYDFTYRRATPEERGWIDAHAGRVSEVVEFRSMAGTGTDFALTQVKAVDAAYPLTGALELDPPGATLAPREGVPAVFLDPALADRLGVAVGDQVLLAGQPFVLAARLLREPDSTGTGIAFGPRSIVDLSALDGTSLLAPGTLYESKYRVTLRPGDSLPALQRAAAARFEGAGMRWSDSRRAAPGVERFTAQLADFLVLVGLAGLAVGGIGISAATNAWIARKAATIATLRALGATGGMIRAVFLLQLAVVAAVGITGGLVLAGLGVWLAAGPIAAAMPIPVEVRLTLRPMLEAGLYGALTAALFTAGPLARMMQLRAAWLYRGGRGGGWGVTAALAVVLVAVAAGLSGRPAITVSVLAAVGAALGLFALVAAGLRRLARWLRPRARGHVALHAALAAISAPRSEVGAVVLSLGLGLSVLSAVGQIDSALRMAIARDLPDQAPAWFLIDIQPDQVAPLTARLRAEPQVARVETAPMLRGVITQINGRPAREGRPDHWVLRGDRGVTFADTPREPLTAGEWWPPGYTGPPQASFGAKEAQELGLKLGDSITVNILGRDITAMITSFRDVNFSTAGIGFVLTLDPAALAGAPFSSIATVYLPPEAEAPLLREIAQSYPNVTAVRVRDAIARVTEALEAIARAVALAASVTLATGLVVLIGAAAAGEPARVREAALLRTLGATRGLVLRSFALRSGLMGAAAGVIAVAVGTLASWAVLRFVMEMPWRFALGPALAIVIGGVLAVLLAGLAFALRPLSRRPAQVLRAPE
ncbi:ABC transporter permease [Paenirhodobacter sp.]|uniref:ABC transporter permease n=1 Tax=Paenirhodobacter sp. TaxID=1965326 RepID=UPI003B3F8CDF